MDRENITQAFTPPPGRLGHSMPAPERVGSPLERMSFRDLHKPNTWARKNLQDGLFRSQVLAQKDAFGSPSFPAPLDKIRSKQDYRVTLDTVTEVSTEQSSIASDGQRSINSKTGGHQLYQFDGASMLSYSYQSQNKLSVSDSCLNNSFIQSFSHSLNTSLNIPSMHMGTNSTLFPSTARNPNKALVTISAQSSQILVANRTASEMFGYQKKQLLGMKVQSLFTEPYRAKQQALVEQHVDGEGGVILVAGKVMDAINSTGVEFPVSVWMKKVGSGGDHRVIVVIEPVARSTARFELDNEGNICSADASMAHLFGYQVADDLDGKSATDLIPSLLMPSSHDEVQLCVSSPDEQKQRITGRLNDGTAFPLTVQLTSKSKTHVTGNSHDSKKRPRDVTYAGKVTVYATLSGMITFLPDGTIHGCNHHFALMLTGYSGDQLKGQDITTLMPEFYLHIDTVNDGSIPLPPGLDDSMGSSVFHAVAEDRIVRVGEDLQPVKSAEKDDSGYKQEGNVDDDSEIDRITQSSSDGECSKSNNSFLDSSVYSEEDRSLNDHQQKQFLSVLDDHSSPYNLKNIPVVKRPQSAREASKGSPPVRSKLFSSTPASLQLQPSVGVAEDFTDSKPKIPEGTFLGDAMHKDGSLLSVVFQLKCITLSDSTQLYCMWISRDFVMDNQLMSADQSLSISHEQLQVPQTGLVASPAWAAPSPHDSFTEGISPWDGEYEKAYETLKQIGKGAFGHVNLAQKKDDQTTVVVKFIRKYSVLQDCWIDDPELGKVPLEICVLTKVYHQNIVKLLAAYENDSYFQMVMEKHGDGMDLFDFIDKNPSLDEPLVSYMFRQIVEAVAYLHGKKILHRDIKDENIILDHHFTIKLIDFGSAAFMEEGKVFGTFCGTLEYCAPEVLLGNKYSGPALEMWSVGVTLYTLVYGENPFFDVEETISSHLQPPFPVSPGLLKVVLWLLHPDPNSRAMIKDLQNDKWTTQPVDINVYSFEAVINGWSHIRKEPSENGTAKVPEDNQDMEEISEIHHSKNTSSSLSTSL